MANSAEENQAWVRDAIAAAGLTDQVEAEAAEIAQARIEMEGM